MRKPGYYWVVRRGDVTSTVGFWTGLVWEFTGTDRIKSDEDLVTINENMLQEQEGAEVNAQINTWKTKAEKWDDLEDKIAAFYGHEDEDGNWIENEEEGGLDLIGEVAAGAFGWL